MANGRNGDQEMMLAIELIIQLSHHQHKFMYHNLLSMEGINTISFEGSYIQYIAYYEWKSDILPSINGTPGWTYAAS